MCEGDSKAASRVIFLVGDFNAEPEDLPEIQHLPNEQHWVDIGANAEKWEGIAFQPRCLAPNAVDKTRRDYIYANPEALVLIRHFQIIDDNKFPVHATLRMTLLGQRAINKRRIAQKPMCIDDKLRANHAALKDNIDGVESSRSIIGSIWEDITCYSTVGTPRMRRRCSHIFATPQVCWETNLLRLFCSCRPGAV